MADYQPISCDDHDRLELAVMHATPLQMTYRDEDGEVRTSSGIRVTDVKTQDKAEWLSFVLATGETKTLRLDSIIAFQE